MIGLLYWVVFAGGWFQLRRAAMRTNQPVRVTGWAVALWLAVAIPSGLQFLWPELLTRGARDGAAIGSGEWWRLLTSLFLQDGGWLGTAFNLFVLAITLVVASAVMRGWVLIVLFLVGGVASNVLTMVIFAQPGAGTSMATLVLVVVVAVWSMRREAPDLVIAAVFVVVAVVLLLARDQHGLAVSFGLLLGVATRRIGRSLAAVGPDRLASEGDQTREQ